MTTALTEDDFTMLYDPEHRFRFIESEDATIMAWGHREAEEFLDEVFAYDKLCDSNYAERGTPGEISHLWAVRDEPGPSDDGDWWIRWSDEKGAFTEATPGAFPVTVWSR
jgi:hypothetical protein